MCIITSRLMRATENSCYSFDTRAGVKEGWLDHAANGRAIAHAAGGTVQIHAGHSIQKTVCSVAWRIQNFGDYRAHRSEKMKGSDSLGQNNFVATLQINATFQRNCLRRSK